MSIIIQKLKQVRTYFSTAKKHERKQVKAFQRIDALKALLIKTVRGYDSKIQELDASHSKALLSYNKQYQAYQNTLSDIRKGLEPDTAKKDAEEALQPFEQIVIEAGEELSTATEYKRQDVLELVQSIKDEEIEYLTAQASAINQEAQEAMILKQRYLDKLQRIADRYGNVMGLEKLMAEASGSVGVHHEMKLSKVISELTKDAPLQSKDISLDIASVTSALR
ncbi:hypothetical protein B481_0131 [Planococcus halocryophilus Or1]|uniref:Phage shock protein A n=1 Tax=Planococcus halocryophilus TaxID=1215089 RepID=A0A1C7DLU2_9BACL|nr:hypothetical protein [Planococcus halocryophilus]ANU12550.1 hypothetical protein BBI08_01175 [Planococcus halocryophilus]EMF48296.1 hypothetical protein B481_0131 [Planococcus halocryophilus Or1]